MSDTKTFQINIPCDDDGYILLRCEHCGTYFKISSDDFKDDGILNFYCPSCGLISEHYLTSDVIELAEAMVQNYAMDTIYDALRDLERSNNDFIQFKVAMKPKYEHESPIRLKIEAMEKSHFGCCHRSAKIKPLLRITGCYCPFCGVKEYEVK